MLHVWGFNWCLPAAISDSTRALKPFLASAMSSVRTSCQLEKSAGEMETEVCERSRTLLVGPRERG